MKADFPIQEMAFEPNGAVGCGQDVRAPNGASGGALGGALVLEEEEAALTVNLPGMLAEGYTGTPVEVKQVSEVIGNLADTIPANCVLKDRFTVQRLLIARLAGEINISRLAAIMGIKRESLHRLLKRGEDRAHPAFEFFYAAFHQFHGATVLEALDVVRKAAHSGNWKAAETFLKIAAPDMGRDEPRAEVNVSGDLMIQVNGVEKSVKEMSTQDLMGVFVEGIGRLPESALRELSSRLPGNVVEIMQARREAAIDG